MRTTQASVEARASRVSEKFRDGLNVELARDQFGRYELLLNDRYGYVRTIDDDLSARQAYLILGGMKEALEIIGR